MRALSFHCGNIVVSVTNRDLSIIVFKVENIFGADLLKSVFHEIFSCSFENCSITHHLRPAELNAFAFYMPAFSVIHLSSSFI